MTTQLDCSIGIKKETTYGTAVVVDQFLEFTSESFDRKATFVQGEGLRVGARVARSGRRSLGREDVLFNAAATADGQFLIQSILED